jgi:hypothetical protein
LEQILKAEFAKGAIDVEGGLGSRNQLIDLLKALVVGFGLIT